MLGGGGLVGILGATFYSHTANTEVKHCHGCFHPPSHLALHGHEEDGAGAVAHQQLVRVLWVEHDCVDSHISRGAGLRGPTEQGTEGGQRK